MDAGLSHPIIPGHAQKSTVYLSKYCFSEKSPGNDSKLVVPYAKRSQSKSKL